MCVCVWVCIHVLPPCGDAFQGDLFICSLNCQTRSSAQVTFYQDFFSHCLHPSQTCTQIDTQAHSHTAFLSPKHLQSCRCPPASQNSACPPYKVNEFHATAVVTSDYQLEGLYSPILINHNHLPEKHSQRDTEIPAYVCQTISTFQFQKYSCLCISNTAQEYTCTDAHRYCQYYESKYMLKMHIYRQRPLRVHTNFVQK